MKDNQNSINHKDPPYYYTVIFFDKPYNFYTYQSNDQIELYSFVEVPFGKTKRIGCLLFQQEECKSNYTIKLIIKTVCSPIWTQKQVEFFIWAHQYYCTPLQEVLQTAFPSSIRNEWFNESRRKKRIETLDHFQARSEESLVLNDCQKSVVQSLQTDGFYRVLIFGVTGSGKTRCYLEVMRYWLQKGNVLFLVPEIHLSHQTMAVLSQALKCNIFIYHSMQTQKKRTETFAATQKHDRGVVFLAARSGVFLPIKNIKMIVLDEEHDLSYRQQEGLFRYNARDLALYRAKQENCLCLMGSATPSPQFLVGESIPIRFELDARATGYINPEVELYRCKDPTSREPLDFYLLKQIRDVLDKKEQVLIFLNKRGYSPKLYCYDCRSFVTCPNCLTPIVYHLEEDIGLCHYCGWQKAYHEIKKCTACSSETACLGFGTERLEEYLKDIFPMTAVYRIDTDVLKTPKQTQSVFEKILSNQPCIILGTQMLSKGHDWPNVTLAILLVGHNKAKEKWTPELIQQVIQTSGRAGRHSKGRVIIPLGYEDVLDKTDCSGDLEGYKQWIKRYTTTHHLYDKKIAKIYFQSKKMEHLLQNLRALISSNQEIYGPFIDYPPRRGVFWRAYIMIVCDTRALRLKSLSYWISSIENSDFLKKSFLAIEIDPILL